MKTVGNGVNWLLLSSAPSHSPFLLALAVERYFFVFLKRFMVQDRGLSWCGPGTGRQFTWAPEK